MGIGLGIYLDVGTGRERGASDVRQRVGLGIPIASETRSSQTQSDNHM